MTTLFQKNKYSSPWPLSLRIKKYLWDMTWVITCKLTPKPFNFWRVFVFKLFGGCVYGTVFIHQSVRIHFPWNVVLHDRACLGERCWVYSVGKITIGEGATVAQEVFVCSGSHDFTSKGQELTIGDINIGKEVFVAARVIILPNVTIEENSIIGAGSVVTKSLGGHKVYAGNPAKFIKNRVM